MDRRTFLSLPVASFLVPTAQAMFTAQPEAQSVPLAAQIDFTSNVPAPGTFPAKWICGSPSAKHNLDPAVQVHWYNEHTAFLRQNKAYSYEAPFMHLYFGNERILMIDQGYTQLRSDWPLRDVVDNCIAEWCRRNGRRPVDMPLLLAFTHLHDDHYAGINQFADRPNTRFMGQTHEEMLGFWGMTNYPEERVTLDLGGRDILIWGNPGHVMSEFAYYDTYTQILFTGDMFYRGRCYISFWETWFASMKRLIAFIDTHPVTHVVGCHVEMSRTGEDYPYGIMYQPDEAPWQLTVDELRHAYEFAKTITRPGIYYTGAVFLCNETRGATTIDKNSYAYD
ncbi:MAG TPA: MBL fold metallo-hydrolase [Terracidiphilus sp.]|nr:MBL fold metallo-hydrolase [Terracidiphilus sp.]